MRRIQRLRQPSAVITQCLQATASTPQPTAVCRAATSCLSRRPRDFSTTPNRPFNRTRTWADKPKTEPVVEKEIFEAPVGAEAEAQAARRRERLSRRTAKAARAEDEFLEPEETKSPSSEQEADPFAAIIAEPSTSESKISLMTDLVLPPTDLTVAPRPSDLDVDADADAEAYKPASTADGLEVIGGLQGWFDPAAEPEKDHWGPSKRFVPFAPVENKVTEPVLLELCAVRAVLEAVALDTYLNERGLGDGPKTLLADTWRNDGIQGFNRVLGMECVIKEDGKVQLGKNWETVARALEADPEAEAAVKDLMPPVQEAAEIAKTWVPGWKKISLQDAKLKFAVAKRTYQLTGHAIPDAKLLHVTNAGQLLALLVKPPPPRTVYDAVQRRGELSQLPNVTVHQKRRTPVDQAKSVGRWKVIEEELEKRGLPVLGKDTVDRFREREWYRGPMPDKKDKKRRR